MPLIDRGVKLHSGIGARPRRICYLTPQITCPHRLRDASRPGDEVPIGVADHRIDELVGHPNRVVGVLASHCGIGFAVEIRWVAGGDECPDLVLLACLPGNERLHIGVVDVDDDHLGGPPRRSSGLDRPRRPIADLEEAHQPR